MSEEMNKPKLLELIRSARQDFESVLEQVPEDRMTQPGVLGEWTVKDILAHIVVWEQRMIRWVNETLHGEVPQMLPPGLTWDDIDPWNEQTYLENRDRPLAEVLSAFGRSYQQALATVEAALEEDLIDPNRFSWREGKPLWTMVAANTFWHYPEHGESIRAWLEKTSTSS